MHTVHTVAGGTPSAHRRQWLKVRKVTERWLVRCGWGCSRRQCACARLCARAVGILGYRRALGRAAHGVRAADAAWPSARLSFDGTPPVPLSGVSVGINRGVINMTELSPMADVAGRPQRGPDAFGKQVLRGGQPRGRGGESGQAQRCWPASGKPRQEGLGCGQRKRRRAAGSVRQVSQRTGE